MWAGLSDTFLTDVAEVIDVTPQIRLFKDCGFCLGGSMLTLLLSLKLLIGETSCHGVKQSVERPML